GVNRPVDQTVKLRLVVAGRRHVGQPNQRVFLEQGVRRLAAIGVWTHPSQTLLGRHVGLVKKQSKHRPSGLNGPGPPGVSAQ
ncbi:MAG: hypothetical protein ACK55I_47105, partial [bacterium]